MDLPNQRDFIEHLTKLAEDGETLLLVRQKLRGRSAEVYADGVLKATWLPVLPKNYRVKEDWAIYGNTGAFILDRLNDNLSASSANCEYCLCMVLDDIGTKSKVPTLEPTWKMETSEGSFQWGYIFSKQPKKGEFTAAILAIAEAGYTDPGAVNAVRNFRIPGSVNLKPGKNNFISCLVEWNPEREFTLSEICAALGVVPGDDVGDGYRPTTVKRTNDEVLNWLSDGGFLLSPPKTDGWASIVCPNYQNHSTPEDVGARYNTNDRGFICYHEHCQHISSQDFLDWVSESGGPSVTHGIDDKELIATLTPALKKLGHDPQMVSEAVKGLEEIQNKQDNRVAKGGLFDRYAYVASDDAFFDLETRAEHPRHVFNAMFRHVECKSIHTGRKIETSVFFDENREKKGSHILSELTYAPGESVIVMRKDKILGNKWRDGRPQFDQSKYTGGVERWIAHGRTLIPNESELEHVFNIMAYKLQNPDKKINHAALHAGREGCGKDTFWAPFIWAVCGPDADNRGYLDSATLNTSWGYHLESEILLINELREPTMSERQALANNLKPIIAAPPETLSVNRKGLHPYEATNRTFVLAFSNSRTPISLAPQDRRWFVIWSEAPRMKAEDATDIWNWYKKGGFETIAAWLYRRDVSMFNPAAAPVDTEYKLTVIEGGMSTAQAWLIFNMRDEIGEFQTGVVGSPFFKVADRLQGSAPSGVKIHHAAILDSLQDAGWHNMGALKSKDNTTKKQVWISPRMLARFNDGKVTKSDLRNMVEQPMSLHTLKIKREAL